MTIIFVQILSKNSSREDRVKKTILVLPKMWTLNVKPWPNGLASRRKLKTWGYLRHRLARACEHLRWLAMTWAHFGRDQIYTQVKASFSPFGHPTQVNASWVTSINGLLANEIQDMSPLKWVYLRLACKFDLDQSERKSSQVNVFNLRLLASPLGDGFRLGSLMKRLWSKS